MTHTHTPTPYIVHYNTDENQHCIVSEERTDSQWNRVVAVVGQAGKAPQHITKENEANAAFIVRACNAHDALVEALELIAASGTQNADVLREYASKALALAEGK